MLWIEFLLKWIVTTLLFLRGLFLQRTYRRRVWWEEEACHSCCTCRPHSWECCFWTKPAGSELQSFWMPSSCLCPSEKLKQQERGVRIKRKQAGQMGLPSSQLTFFHAWVQLGDFDGQTIDAILKRVCTHIKGVCFIKKLPKNVFCLFTCKHKQRKEGNESFTGTTKTLADRFS